MKKLATALVLALALLAATGGEASAYTPAQQDALLNTLKAKLACLQRTPVSEYGDPAGSDWGYMWDNHTSGDPLLDPPALLAETGASALDFSFGATPDAWVATVKNTSTCRAKFALAPTPSWWPVARLAHYRQLARVE